MSIQVKIILTLILVGIIGAVGWDLKTSHELIGTQKTTIDQQALTIKGYKDKAKEDKVVDKIFDTAQDNVNQGAQNVRDHQGKVEQKVDTNVEAIKKRYDAIIAQAKKDAEAKNASKEEVLAQELALQEAKATEVSGERFAGIWENYYHAAGITENAAKTADNANQTP